MSLDGIVEVRRTGASRPARDRRRRPRGCFRWRSGALTACWARSASWSSSRSHLGRRRDDHGKEHVRRSSWSVGPVGSLDGWWGDARVIHHPSVRSSSSRASPDGRAFAAEAEGDPSGVIDAARSVPHVLVEVQQWHHGRRRRRALAVCLDVDEQYLNPASWTRWRSTSCPSSSSARSPGSSRGPRSPGLVGTGRRLRSAGTSSCEEPVAEGERPRHRDGGVSDGGSTFSQASPSTASVDSDPRRCVGQAG